MLKALFAGPGSLTGVLSVVWSYSTRPPNITNSKVRQEASGASGAFGLPSVL